MRYLHRRSLAAAVALCAAVAALTARAADWTDATSATYTALKSINGGYSGYIATDIVPSGKDTVKFKYKPSKVTGNECIYCSRYADGSYMKRQFCGFRIGSAFRVDSHDHYKAGNTTYSRQFSCDTTKPLTAGTEYTLSADYNNAIVTINGTEQTLTAPNSSGMTPSSSTDFTPGSILVLLASHTSSSANATSAATLTGISNLATGDLYYLQLWSYDGTLAHNFMPAERDSDSAVGLYDTVTRKFYPATGGTLTGVAYGASERAGKKWTGAAGDGLMSTGANWEGGVAPQAGDDIDFTIAVPFAAIVADIDVTFGKIYLGAGDLPAFSGTLKATAINDLTRMQAYDTAAEGFTFTLEAPSGQDFTWNGGAAANWSTTDASWLYNNAASVWYDHNNAIFNTADATVTLTENAEPDALVFNQNATVGGTATLTVTNISVAADVAATISAPTAGALEKTGAGTLTLGSSRTAQTTVSEGTLTLSGSGTTIDWAKLALGTDPAKPVTLRFEDGAALSSMSTEYNFGNIANITSTICKADGDWKRTAITRIGRVAGGNTTFVNESGDLEFTYYLSIGALAEAASNAKATGELAIAGGTVSVSHADGSSAPYITVGSYGDGIVTVTNNAAFNVKASMALSTHAGSGTLNVSDGGTATIGTELVCGWSNSDAGTGTVNLGTGGTLATKTMRCASSYGTGVVNFDGGTLKATNTTTTLIQASDRLTVNVSANGGTIDNAGNNITIAQGLSGTGTINLTGSGTTTFASGVGAEGGVSVANGTTLALDGATQSSFGALTLAAGSTLDIATPASDSAAFAATTLNLPAEGTVALTSDGGAFVEGLYAICEMSGVTAADGAKFAPSNGTLAVSWSVAGDTLMLAVGDIDPNTWTGRAGDGNLSNPENWLGRAVPTSGTATINTSGALTVGDLFSPDVIVFPETCGAVTIAGQNAITGISAITNLSSSICTFEVPVAFASEINVYQTASYYSDGSGNEHEREGGRVSFPGGVTGSSFAEGTSHMLEGAYFVPATADWQASTEGEGLWGLCGDTKASLTITGSSSETPAPTNTSMLLVNSGSALTTGVMRTSSRLSYRVYGEYVVTNELEVALTAGTYIAQRYSTGGKYKFEKLTLSESGTAGGNIFWLANSSLGNAQKHVYIGAGGININAAMNSNTALSCGTHKDDTTHLYPWHSDYAINGKGGSTRDFIVYRATYLHTDDENGVARTVTLNGIADIRAALTVNGHGRLQVNSDGMNGESGRIGGVTVTDSATLAYASGADLGAGAVTVGVNATLEVASGVHTFNGGLTLNDGATLAFNFTQRAVTPQIAIAEGKSLTVNGAVNVKIPEGSLRPTGGEKVLTTCGGFDAEGVTVSLVEGAPKWVNRLSVNTDGNLVLDVKPMGTLIIFR